MPSELKDLFFPGVSKPDLVEEYDVLGFDADHCIVKYNIEPLCRLMMKGMSADLVEMAGYPPELMELSDDLIGMSINNSVWDIENNTILELGEGKVVTNAYKGTRKLTDDDIVQLYGESRVFQHLEYPTKLK